MKRSINTILLVGALAGTFDMAAAMIRYYKATGKDPMEVLRFIASGIFGTEAFAGGVLMGSYGLILHFIIAYWWTALYFFLYPRFKFSSVDRYLAAIIYGAVIWSVMNLIVLPLSNVPSRPFDLMNALDAAVIVIVCIGLPITRGIHNHYSTMEK